ncbi:S8 family peptidase [Paenibacillus turpanensis]|uniref:S8 family peptidase n=1 Tax=Paenibacillus turpanensis TaxID=2689078 RepID=UPI003C7A0F5C
MNTNQLLDRLLREAETSRKDDRSYIIRFRNPALYKRFVKQLRELKKEKGVPSSLLPISLIRGIACPLRSVRILQAFGSSIHVEANPKIRVHSLAKAELQSFIPWGVKQVRAPYVWPISQGAGIRIGVIDTGVDYSHPDLQPVLSRGINMLNPRILPIDDNGHGTHIAGTIAACGHNDGITGIAPMAKIFPVKAFDYNGTAYVSDIIHGIDWCVRNGMHIINMSFGMKKRSDSLLAAVQSAERAGVLIITSSGNDGKKAELDYPARFPSTIAVGATDKKNRIASFSNRGKGVDVYAPGDKIYSTWLRGKYNAMSGTSMATAHVSGMIALTLAAKPGLKPAQIRALLKRAVVKPVRRGKRGPGRLDAPRLLKLASGPRVARKG